VRRQLRDVHAVVSLRGVTRLPVDTFVLLLLATVGLAVLFPARGATADGADPGPLDTASGDGWTVGRLARLSRGDAVVLVLCRIEEEPGVGPADGACAVPGDQRRADHVATDACFTRFS
jgi:hypothetical protein